MLRFKNLRKAFGGQTVLAGISGEIRQGEVILLRGENGSGKTTLLNILTGCLEPDGGSIKYSALPASHSPSDPPHSSFHFPRPWHADLNPFQQFTPESVARLGIGRTWQDVRLFGSLDLADNVAAAAPDASDSPWSALFRPRHSAETNRLNRQTAADTLATLGFSDREHSSADKISLGQSKRVAIARALQADARILFLDEPLAGLDTDGMRDVLANLHELAAKHNLTLVIIEHVLNIPRLLDFVTKVWSLKNGDFTESCPDVIRKEIDQDNTSSDIHALIRQVMGKTVASLTQAMPQGGKLTTYAIELTKLGEDHLPTLNIQNLNFQMGGHLLFPDSPGLSFQLWPKTVNVLEAPNGWGKSSITNALAGVIPFQAEGCQLYGTPLSSEPWSRQQQGLVVCRSNNTTFPSLTQNEHFRLVVKPKTTESESCIINSPKRALLLSGGERQRLALLLVSRVGNHALILDEPFSQLDNQQSLKLAQLVCGNPIGCVLIFSPGM